MTGENVLTIPNLSRTKKITGVLEVPGDCSRAFLPCLCQHIKDLENSVKEIISFSLVDDSADWTHWKAEIQGPIDTPYENGIFILDIHFSLDYPFKPPNIKFETRVFHPNISSKGEICSDRLREMWNPVFTLETMLLSIVSFLSDPNPDDFLAPKAANLYKSNLEGYNQEAKEYTRKYAMPLSDPFEVQNNLDEICSFIILEFKACKEFSKRLIELRDPSIRMDTSSSSSDQIVLQEATDDAPTNMLETDKFNVFEPLGTKTFDNGESKQPLSIVAKCMKSEKYHLRMHREPLAEYITYLAHRYDWAMYDNLENYDKQQSQNTSLYSEEFITFLKAWLDYYDYGIYNSDIFKTHPSIRTRLRYSRAFRTWTDGFDCDEDRQNIAGDLLSLAIVLEKEGHRLGKQNDARSLIIELHTLISKHPDEFGQWFAHLYSMPTFLYSQLNQFLREAANTKIETYGLFARLLCGYFNHPSSIEIHGIEVYRGMNLSPSMIDAYKKAVKSGTSFRWASFTSTSKIQDTAQRYGDNTLFILKLKKTYPKEKKAIDISKHSTSSHEEEVLLKFGVEFTVESVEYNNEKKKYFISLNVYV